MSTEVALSVDGMNLADAMGFTATKVQAQSTLWRVTAVVKQGIDGKKIVNTPMFKLRKGDEEVYTESLSVRLFAERQQWTKWDSEANTTQKTVLAQNLNNDLKDTLGGFNLGRRAGYVPDWDALPETTKNLMRTVKRTKVFMGMAGAIEATNEDGDSIEFSGEVPFIFDVKNPTSLKSMDAATSAMVGKGITPIEHTILLGANQQTMPNGNMFAEVSASLGERVGFTDGDNETLRDFIAYIERTNSWVLSKWDERNVANISPEDAAIVGSIVEVQDFE